MDKSCDDIGAGAQRTAAGSLTILGFTILGAARRRRIPSACARARIWARVPLAAAAALQIACGGGDAPPTGPGGGGGAGGTVAVASVSVAPGTASLTPGQTAQLSATTRDASGNTLTGRAVSWSTNLGAVATVSASGLVTAVSPGSAVITATSEGRSATAQVTVAPTPVATVTLSLTADTLQVGQTRTLLATTTATGGAVLTGRVITWTSNQPAIATVTDGLVSAISPGVAVVTATSEGQSASANVVVRPVAVARVVMSRDSVSLLEGGTATLSAVPQAADSTALVRPITWTSSNSAIATVVDGTIAAIAAGTTTVTATSEGVSATAKVTVRRIPVATVQIAPTSDSLEVGQTSTLVASVRDDADGVLTGRTVSWSSSASAIATVADGVVTAISPGAATITATSEGQSASAQIIVSARFEIADIRRTIEPGYEQACAISSAGGTYCWGNQRYGAVGNGVMRDSVRSTAALVLGGHLFTSLTGGYSHACGLTNGGDAWCWGRAQLGQLGDSTTTNSAQPVAVSGGHKFVQISSGSSDRTCGVTATGETWCWGSNANYALGVNASGVGSATPLRVVGNHTFRQVVGGSSGVCALRDDGAPYCWGSNAYGQLGIGSFGSASAVPIEVTGEHRFVQLVAGYGHYCGRKPDNTVWCWGFNSLGQLGDQTTVNRSTPVLAQGGMPFQSITAAAVTTCGLDSNGSASCWGGGSGGTLGNGDVSSGIHNASPTPVTVNGGLRFRELSATAQTVCGVTVDHVTYCWGSSFYGNIGDGFRINRGSPTAVVGLP